MLKETFNYDLIIIHNYHLKYLVIQIMQVISKMTYNDEIFI